YKCTRCNAAFNRRHDLSRHVRIHEGIRPYFCQQCGRGFSRQDALARHHANSRGCSGLPGGTPSGGASGGGGGSGASGSTA
ncbi:hypothetical protein BDZ88DRAFT_392775, partial [Geranomyces variabilis]